MLHRVANLTSRAGRSGAGQSHCRSCPGVPVDLHAASALLRRRRPVCERLRGGTVRRGAPLGLGLVPVRDRPDAAAGGLGRAVVSGTHTGPRLVSQRGSSGGAVSTTLRLREIGDLDR